MARLARRVREGEVYGPPPWAADAPGRDDGRGDKEREERVRAAAVNWTDPGEALEGDLVVGYEELCALLREPVAAPLLGMIDSFVKVWPRRSFAAGQGQYSRCSAAGHHTLTAAASRSLLTAVTAVGSHHMMALMAQALTGAAAKA